MTATYQFGQLSLLYPENWLLSETDSIADDRSVQLTLEAPSGGLWMLSTAPASADISALIREASQAIGDQFDDVEWSEFDQDFFGHRATGVDGFFYSLDLLICAKIRCFKTLDHTIVVVIQSESRALEKDSDVFDAITLSLLQSSKTVRASTQTPER